LVVLFGLLYGHLAIPPVPATGTIIRLQADRIEFYYDRYLIEADGHVRVTTSDGMTITGDAFSMDLKLNRFLIASHVHLRSPGGQLDGAAIADFIDFRRIYFVPVITKPDRWTYENGDFAHAFHGRQMPGDTFFFPDTHASKVSLAARGAVIQSRAFVRFESVRAYVTGASFPLPSYYVYFGPNRNMAANSLSGANFDATWNATGNANSITALHARYDNTNQEYLAFEQHLAGPNGYAVVSVNPLTKLEHFWNLVGSERVGSRFQFNLFAQLEETQRWLQEPESASLVYYPSIIQAFNQSYVQVTGQFVNYNLVNQYRINHPSAVTATATTANHRIGKTPLYESIFYGIGFNHDSNNPEYQQALQTLGGVQYTTIWDHFLGYTLSLPNIKLGDRSNPYHTYYFNGSVNAERTWNSTPHHVNGANTTFSLSRTFSRFVNSYVSYNVANTADIYNVGGYSTGYVPISSDGVPDYSYAAFKGASTLRVATFGTTYTASPNLVTTLTYQHHDDFPVGVPNLFPPSPINNIGQFAYSNYLGQFIDAVTGEVRARLAPHLVIDFQRTYYFNFGTLKWSPSFVVQFSQ
jgi:hypothetical protein